MVESLLPEFDQEMATTRRLIERVPDDKGEWKPHHKSFSLGHLAQLVSWMPDWITVALERASLDLSSGPRYSIERTRTLLDGFDRNVREARAAIARTGDESLREPRSLTLGERVLFTSTRGETVRQNISHLVHHRGQFTVYLRLLDVPIPSIYGPTADEGWSG